MGELVTVVQAADYLGGIEPDDSLIQLVTQVEDAFNRACGRQDRPFQSPQTARTERHDGNGRSVLFLNYPITDLTSIKLGFDSTVPDETLDVDDRTALIWDVGQRRVTRIDGGFFGYPGSPSYVQVVYDAAEDRPSQAESAILRPVAALYNQRGAEDEKAVLSGGYRSELADPAADPIWREAVMASGDPGW